jgi:hypothetical protein
MVVTSPSLAKILNGTMKPIKEEKRVGNKYAPQDKYAPRRNTLLGPGPALYNPDKFD